MPDPWYARSPFKDIITHSATLCIGILFALLIHRCTGETVVIEAKKDTSLDGVGAAAGAPEEPAAAAARVVIVELEAGVAVSASAVALVPAPVRAIPRRP